MANSFSVSETVVSFNAPATPTSRGHFRGRRFIVPASHSLDRTQTVHAGFVYVPPLTKRRRALTVGLVNPDEQSLQSVSRFGCSCMNSFGNQRLVKHPKIANQ